MRADCDRQAAVPGPPEASLFACRCRLTRQGAEDGSPGLVPVCLREGLIGGPGRPWMKDILLGALGVQCGAWGSQPQQGLLGKSPQTAEKAGHLAAVLPPGLSLGRERPWDTEFL